MLIPYAKKTTMTLLHHVIKNKALFYICLLLFLKPFCISSQAQSQAWNAGSFKFTRDNVTPEDMTGAANVTFSGSPVTSSPVISVAGFSFRFGLSSYSDLYISPYGFLKLGSPIVSNNPENDSTVIVALCNGTYWDASYKLAGSAPNRRLVIEYNGVMQPSGEPTSFQIWLYEKTGKIQFVYAHLSGYYGYSNFWSYKIFCSTSILNQKNIAAAKVNANNAYPTTNYSAVPVSFDSIYTNTRFTFEPDTAKPAIPSLLNFTNIQPGCLAVNLTEGSGNESVIMLEKADSGTNYRLEKLYYTTSPAGNTTYNYSQTLLQPYWNYNYRTYVTNGFLNSDTLYSSVQTLMPQINGIKTVPGDYPSITALLQDAPCKHLGPNLVIELQNNYSFNSETLPLTFSPGMQNRFIQTIVIRPAANATINWTDSLPGALFYVDSVKHVFLDGRAGGTGNTRNFTIFQKNPYASAIQYTNAADSGGINYCNIIKKNGTNLTYAIVVVPLSYAYNYSKKDINAFSITNNFISADSATVSDLVYINPADTLKARDFIISGNQFSRFRRSAVHFENGGENLQIKNNLFFQPELFRPEVYLPYTNASCLTLINTEKVFVDNNFFGGESPVWGTGKFKVYLSGSDFSFINYQNNSLTKKAFITNNKFGNIEGTGYGYASSAPRLIYAYKGDVVIDHNQFGTADSTNSITNQAYFWGIDLWFGYKTVRNNFFSGIQGSYLTSGYSNHSYFITSTFTDSCAFLNNDIGGSNDPAANSSTDIIHGIYLSSTEKNITIKNNLIRGISSRNVSVIGISGANSISNPNLSKLEIDSNSIHHIQAAANVTGIAMNIDSKATNRISYNNIYALKTTGTAAGAYGPTGNLYGIIYSIYNYGLPPVEFTGEVQIFGNKIHSFESLRSLPNSIYSYYGITATSPVTKIYNNEIRFGIDSKGQFIDSVTSLNGIVIAPVDYQTLLSDKHYIEHNTLYFGGKGLMGSAIAVGYSYNYVSPKNSVTITNNILNIDRIPLAGSSITASTYQGIESIQAYSAKNIWYSTGIPTTATLLQTYKQTCHCDSSSFVGDPKFINATGDSSNYDLHLGPLSLADSAGTPSVLNIQSDIDNINRNAYSPVDIGCYASNPCGTGIFPSITITNPLTDTIQLCAGANITLKSTVSGGSFSNLQWQRNLIDSVGANTDSLVVSTAGNYRLIGKTVCGTVASRMVYVVGNSLLPSVSITTATTTICSGNTATFTATTINGGSSLSYQWLVNDINTGTNSSSFTTAMLTSDAQVKVVISLISCNATVTATSNIITITVNALPIVNAGSDVAICGGTNTQLNGSGGITYSWFPTTGLSNPTVANPIASPANNIAYILTVSNSNNCFAKDTVIVTVIQQSQSPTVNISTANNNICSGSPVTFTATSINGGNNPAYQWQVNAAGVGTNSSTYTSSNLSNGDQVIVTITSNSNCVTIPTAISNIITMAVDQLAIPVITLSGRVYTITNPDVTVVYSWQMFNNNIWTDILPNANDITYTATTSGDYRVKAEKGACTIYSAAVFTNLLNGPSGNNPYGIYLYPNPGHTTIILDSVSLSQRWQTASVIDGMGSQVLPTIDIRNQSRISININMLTSGIYFLKLKREDGESSTIKFIKQ